MFHLLGQLAASPRKTSSTGFLFLFLPLQGWGKRLSLRFDPPLPSLAALPRWLGPIAAPRTCPGWRRAARPGPGCAEPRRARGRAPRTVAARGGGRAGHRAGGGGRRAEVWRCPADAAPMTELQQDVEDAKPAKVLGKREGKVGSAQWVLPAGTRPPR